MNLKEDKLKRLVFKLINRHVEGVDIYHRDSGMWLIFTDEKRWVIELTKKGILWYNHNFFDNIFKFFSMDVIENQHYITEWVEDTLQNGVKNTNHHRFCASHAVEDTLQNGVKNTFIATLISEELIEDTIQNGVKTTEIGFEYTAKAVESIIQNGTKI